MDTVTVPVCSECYKLIPEGNIGLGEKINEFLKLQIKAQRTNGPTRSHEDAPLGWSRNHWLSSRVDVVLILTDITVCSSPTRTSARRVGYLSEFGIVGVKYLQNFYSTAEL